VGDRAMVEHVFVLNRFALLRFDRVALPPLGHPLWVCVELLGTRKDPPEVLGHGVDLFDAHQALDQDPTFFLPRRDFGVLSKA